MQRVDDFLRINLAVRQAFEYLAIAGSSSKGRDLSQGNSLD